MIRSLCQGSSFSVYRNTVFEMKSLGKFVKRTNLHNSYYFVTHRCFCRTVFQRSVFDGLKSKFGLTKDNDQAETEKKQKSSKTKNNVNSTTTNKTVLNSTGLKDSRVSTAQDYSVSNSALTDTHESTLLDTDSDLSHKALKVARKLRKVQKRQVTEKQAEVVGLKPNEKAYVRMADQSSTGVDITGHLDKDGVTQVLNKFFEGEHILAAAQDQGLKEAEFLGSKLSFRKFISQHIDELPVELHVLLYDIVHGAKHPDELFSFFMIHAKKVFPSLEFRLDLEKISNITQPANWYPEARRMKRKIIFHSGPTNSGKTYHALKSYMAADSGVYCGPLRLLAVEIFNKCKEQNVPCDLLTGEERRYFTSPEQPASHISCTVEMTSVTQEYDVAVIDEIQMIQDNQRGAAWTRVLLGLCAREIHVCGERRAVDIVKKLVAVTDDEFELKEYKRMTPLKFENSALGDLSSVRPGDCIVCFSKAKIYNICLQLEKKYKKCAVIYGALPAATKIEQARIFNDTSDNCNILVATDAIGMGLNLNIRRVIFHSLQKITENASGDLEINYISTSQAKQIAGRAGRFNSTYNVGYVTAMSEEGLEELKIIMKQPVEDIKYACLQPTLDMLEQFSFYLPDLSLHDLIDFFIDMSKWDESLYFLANMLTMKELSKAIEHISLPLRVKYQFCMAPASIKEDMPLVITMFAKFARMYSSGTPITHQWLLEQTDYPYSRPKDIKSITYLEAVYEVMDLYLWLSYRFPDIFPERDYIMELQSEVLKVISEGVKKFSVIANANRDPETPVTKGKIDTKSLMRKTSLSKRQIKKMSK